MIFFGLVVELYLEFDFLEICYFFFCDIFMIIYKGILIGYFDLVYYNLCIDLNEVK